MEGLRTDELADFLQERDVGEGSQYSAVTAFAPGDPTHAPLSAGLVLGLQRRSGNAAVTALLQGRRVAVQADSAPVPAHPVDQQDAGPPGTPAAAALDVSSARRVVVGGATYHVFPLPLPAPQTRPRSGRPLFILDRVTGRVGGKPLHAAAVGPAQALLDAMHAAGSELGDASLLGAYILSGWRSVPDEGSKFRGALQRHLLVFFQNPKKNKDWEQWAKLTIPQDVLDLAEEQLVGKGHTHSVDDLRKKLAQAPGWNPTLADKLVNHTKGNKAPSGGSPHHSGVVIDINWPSVADGKVQPHDVRFERNDEARRSAAGVWLSLYAGQYGFASYNTAKEIWHMEWLDWRGSAADPLTKATGRP